jgi:hypothetical protein
VERADADAIACQDHHPLGEIEQREGKLALQMREQILAVLLIEMHDQLAIAAGAELMTPRLKLGLALRIVEQLAVARHGERAVLVDDRLLAVAQAYDAEPLRGGADPWGEQGAGFVGAAMGERRAHARNLRPIRLPSTFKVDYTCQAAHFTSLKMIPGWA